MPLPSTMTPISTVTLTSAGVVTFSSIPQTYTDLVLIVNAISSVGYNFRLRLNDDSSANVYSWTLLTTGGSSAAAGSQGSSSQTSLRISFYGYVDTVPGTHIINLQNYSNTSVHKTLLSRASNANNGLTLNVGRWANTAAITSITTVDSYDAGSTFTLYGIKAA